MHNNELGGQESDDQLIKDITQLNLQEVAECHVCGEKPLEGDGLVVFAFRPADKPAFEIGHVKCSGCRHEPTEFFTLDVRELVLDGRVGRCTDQATQSSWPVLLAPQPRAVSPADTTTVHPLPGTTWYRHPIARSDVYSAADCASTRKPWQRPVVRADTAPENSSDAHTDTDDDTVEPNPHMLASGPGGVR